MRGPDIEDGKSVSGETVEIAVETIRETNEAYLFSDGTKEVWIPKSQVINTEENKQGDIETIEIPIGLATKDGLI